MSHKVQPIRPSIDAATRLERMAKIDEYGEIKRRLQLAEPDEQRAKALKDEIEGWHKDGPGDVPITERGAAYEVQLSPRRNERTIVDKRKAFDRLKKALGMDGLIAILDIPLTAGVDKVVPKSEQKAFIAEERSGYRTLTVVALAPAPVAKAA
jgi:hypothetical protein